MYSSPMMIFSRASTCPARGSWVRSKYSRTLSMNGTYVGSSFF